MIRPGDAPNAKRNAISPVRRVARLKSRFATFAHAMRSTKATATWAMIKPWPGMALAAFLMGW